MATLSEAHTEYEYTALVRNSDQGPLVAASYPRIKLVYGTLDDQALLEEEIARADIVLHNSYLSLSFSSYTEVLT